MKVIIVIATLSLGVFALAKAGYRNVSKTKSAASKVWSESGFKIVGYEGYQWEPLFGGKVWHIVERKDLPGVLYHGFLSKWGEEYHIYNLRAIDAIRPN